jgi:hypothetical protein
MFVCVFREQTSAKIITLVFYFEFQTLNCVIALCPRGIVLHNYVIEFVIVTHYRLSQILPQIDNEITNKDVEIG